MFKKNQVTLISLIIMFSCASMLSACSEKEPTISKPIPVVLRQPPSAEYSEGVLDLQYNKIKIKIPYSEVYSDVRADSGYFRMYFHWPDFSSGRNKMRTQEDYIQIGINYAYKSKDKKRGFDDLQKDIKDGFFLPGARSAEFEGLIEYKRKSAEKAEIYQPDDLNVMKSYEGKPVIMFCDYGHKNYRDSVCRYQIYLSEDVSYIVDYRKDKLKDWKLIQNKVKNLIDSIIVEE